LAFRFTKSLRKNNYSFRLLPEGPKVQGRGVYGLAKADLIMTARSLHIKM